MYNDICSVYQNKFYLKNNIIKNYYFIKKYKTNNK